MLLAQIPLHAGWLGDPAGRTLANPFHGTHAWAVEAVGSALWSGHWPDPTRLAGFPQLHHARYVGQAFLLVGAVLRPLVSGVVVANLAGWLGPALGAGAMVGLARRLHPAPTDAGLVLGGVAFGLAPVTLGAAASGQLENAQAWVLPLLLLTVPWAADRWARAPVVGVAWLLGALTSPYLAMAAALGAPWAAWRVGLRRVGPSAVGALGGLLLAGAWLDAGGYDAATHVFKPTWTGDGWPPLWGDPLPVADLDTLLTGVAAPQVKAMVLHQPYLGLAAGAAALLLGRERAAWAAPVALGALVALGPELGWDGAPVELAGQRLAMPAMVLRWLDLPVAHGGQYYRFAVLVWLGWGGMLAGARRPAPAVAAGLVVALDAGRAVSSVGLPWPCTALPATAWAAWAADPEPGGVVHVPTFSPHLTPNHPVRLAGVAVHGRPVADLPRAEAVPARSAGVQALDRCTRRGTACPLPDRIVLANEGFRYVVLDLPDVPEQVALRPRLEAAWGPPDGDVDGLVWWRTR